MMPPNRLFIHYFETKELNIVLSNYKLFLSSYLIYVYIYFFVFLSLLLLPSNCPSQFLSSCLCLNNFSYSFSNPRLTVFLSVLMHGAPLSLAAFPISHPA